MSKPIHCDIAIIGAGSGGLSLAAGASQLGLKVILVEKGLMGGDCLNYGCVPSKSLLAAAKSHWQANHAQNLGTRDAKSPVDFDKVMHHLKSVIKTIAVNDSVARFESLGVRVIQEAGCFTDKTTLKAGTTKIKATYFVIATGSSASIPPIPGLDAVHFYTNETIFNVTELPKQLIIIGGGPIGCEMAQAFAMLGSEVTLLEGETVLAQDDPEAVNVVRDALIETGITLKEHFKVIQISQNSKGTILVTGESNGSKKSFDGTHLLIAAGRTPNIAELRCELAEIEYTKKGITVDKRLRTSNKKIFAIGDVTGTLQFTHVANDHAGIVLRNIAFKLPAKVNKSAVPWVTYTEPELAQVGLNAATCDTLKIKYTVVKTDYSNNDRAETDQQTKGFIKAIVTPKGAILGVTIVGHQAGELLLPWIIAIREGKTLRTFTDVIVPYPTLSELSKRVASQFYAPKLFSKPVKKLVKFLSYFHF